jgi:polar amino acid transport system substrate-binding protein
MRVRFGTAIVAASLIAFGPVMAPESVLAQTNIPCGSEYTVKPGDTLYEIAISAYGDGSLYGKIILANSELTRNVRAVEIDEKLLIPCLDGAEAELVPPGEARTGGLVTEIEARLLAPVGSISDDAVLTEFPGQRISFITGPHGAPLSQAAGNLNEMLTGLVIRALRATAPKQDLQIAFINDWLEETGGLLHHHEYDVGFPAYKPDCARSDQFTPEKRSLCGAFEFSNPFLEVSIGAYTLAGGALVSATNLEALVGKKICHPKDSFMLDPLADALSALDVSVETPATAQACFIRLARGQVDVVSTIREKAEDALRQLDMAGSVAEIPDLGSTRTLHAVALKSNPNGRAYLDLIDQGLSKLMQSGEWFEIISFSRNPDFARIK